MPSKKLPSRTTRWSNGTRAIRWLTYAAALLLLLPRVAPAVILDPCPEDDVLYSLAKPLDAVEIDVILGKASDFLAGDRPRLAQLQGFVGRDRDWGSFAPDAWKYALKEGISGALIALESSSGADMLPPKMREEFERCQAEGSKSERETCRFLAEWVRTPAEGRVFVAFTRSDQGLALLVQREFKAKGYSTFIYLREGDVDPWADPGLVGEVFAMSNHHFVLDTKNARGSEGVQVEAHCCAWALSPAIVSRPEWRRALTYAHERQ